MSETPHYYNTLNIGGQNLLLAIENAKKQKARVMVIMQAKRRKMTPSEVHSVYIAWFKGNPPLTSIRRSMTDLTTACKLEKTNDKVMGIYGQPEHKWQLPESKPIEIELPDYMKAPKMNF
jgi:hypothetical protein